MVDQDATVPKIKISNLVRTDYNEKEDVKKFLAAMPGTLSENIRRATATLKATYEGSVEILILEKEIPELKHTLYSKENKLREIKDAKARKEDELETKEKRIEEAHEKLLDALKRALWKPERIQRATFKIYADFTGLSVQELIDWVNEQAKRRDELE